jgi:hypothetical protein
MRYGLAALGALLLTAAANATVIISADLRELTHDAVAIARGGVVAVNGQWTPDRRGVETIVTLEVYEYLKGGLGETLQFRVPGGVLGRYRNVVVGAPRFDVGQQVIVFLGARGPTIPFLLGLNQGVYRIERSDSGAAVVTPPPVMPGTVGPVVRGSAELIPARLADFERNVRALVTQ